MVGLIAQSIRKTFPTPTGELVVLSNVSLSLDQGEAMAIVGPSGCGKSTLLHCLGTLDSPSSGSLNIDGVNPFSLSEKELASFRNQKLGFVFQDHFLLPQLTAIQNVLVPALANGRVSPEIATRANKLLESVGIASRSGHLPGQLSGGEKARVAIARALIMEPRIVLADEPTGSLDPKNAEIIAELLLEIQRNQAVSLIVVTHSNALASMLPKKLELEASV